MLIRTRQILLLEVMIAMAIIALCILPLMYPLVGIVRVQKNFIQKIELDHAVSCLFADLYEQMLKNQIPFSEIQSKKQIEIPQDTLKKLNGDKPLLFKGYYYFEEDKRKPQNDDNSPTIAYIFDIHFLFNSLYPSKDFSNKPLKYSYKVFIIKNAKSNTIKEEEEKNEQSS